jgi:hypothetical protein
MRVIAALLMLSPFAVQAGQKVRETGFRVTVCTDGDSDTGLANLSRAIASGMFRAIGVKIDWRLEFGGCPPHAILIALSDRTPAGLMPGALAYALPFEGSHILIVPGPDRGERLRDTAAASACARIGS